MLNYKPLLFITGLVLSKLALFMYILLGLALLTGSVEFFQSIIITHLASFTFLHFGKTKEFRLGIREMFLLTTGVWVLGSAFAALPFMLIEHIIPKLLGNAGISKSRSDRVQGIKPKV